jgi:hypothetical protein
VNGIHPVYELFVGSEGRGAAVQRITFSVVSEIEAEVEDCLGNTGKTSV